MFEKKLIDLNSVDRLSHRCFEDLKKVIIDHAKRLEKTGIQRNIQIITSNALWNMVLVNADLIGDKDLTFTKDSLQRMFETRVKQLKEAK